MTIDQMKLTMPSVRMLVLGSPNVGKSGISSSLSTFVVVLDLNYCIFLFFHFYFCKDKNVFNDRKFKKKIHRFFFNN